jgi:hypothetical protein
MARDHTCVCRNMFNDIVDDTASSCVKLSDSPARLACMVNHIYGGDKYTIDSGNVLDCSCVAAKYDIPGLQRAVIPVVRQLHLTASNVPDYMAVAHESPALRELKERCIEYAARRLEHILACRYVGAVCGRCCIVLYTMFAVAI